MSWDGATILAGCDDGTLQRWDREVPTAAGGAGGNGSSDDEADYMMTDS